MILTITLVVLVLVVVCLFNPNAVSRIVGAGRAQVGKAGRAAENADPLAMFQQQIDDAATAMQSQLVALKSANTQLEGLQRQVRDDTQEKLRLESRIKSALEKGDPNNTAKGYALQLAQVEKNLEINKGQLERQEKICTEYGHSVDLNRQKIREAQQESQRLGLELKQSEAQKVATEQFAQLTNTDLFTGVSTIKQKLQEKIDANRASARVDADQCSETLAQMKDEEDERQLQADEILARFKSPETPTS
jgi:phage shock protein A